ncbi:hypothetical protein GZL_01968 [Streptomyces sp. 769]|nr:hypothetical protein GZL_01968 [Streptomyces sp. 769]
MPSPTGPGSLRGRLGPLRGSGRHGRPPDRPLAVHGARTLVVAGVGFGPPSGFRYPTPPP